MLKVKLIDENGEKRVPPETFDLLISFGQHRQFCDTCQLASSGKGAMPCSVGLAILTKLKDQEGVEFTR